MMHVDVVPSDIWTSSILSSGGHCDYDLFLDDFIIFFYKSLVHSMFIQFCAHIKTQFERKIKAKLQFWPPKFANVAILAP